MELLRIALVPYRVVLTPGLHRTTLSDVVYINRPRSCACFRIRPALTLPIDELAEHIVRYRLGLSVS